MIAQIRTLFVIGAASIHCGCSFSQSENDASDAKPLTESSANDEAPDLDSVYTVATYDPSANPDADLASTVSVASATGKRIVLEIGGQW